MRVRLPFAWISLKVKMLSSNKLLAVLDILRKEVKSLQHELHLAHEEIARLNVLYGNRQ